MNWIRGPLAALLVMIAAPALAHEAGPLMPPGVKAQVVQEFPKTVPANNGPQPEGWTYGWECCSGLDCARVPKDSVHETPQGYVVDGSADDAPIEYSSKRIKLSKDEDYHWCAHRSGPDKGKTICIYVPNKGY